MKITMYDLLGLVKDDKAPKKIIAGSEECEYFYDSELKDYRNIKTNEKLFEDEIEEYIKYYLNDEVEVIEEEKKIPEKIKDKYCSQISKVELAQKYNEIIDYLKSKGD